MSVELTTKEVVGFWLRVTPTDGCWLWGGTRANTGYGVIQIKRKRLYVHRIAYEMLVGEIPIGYQIDHVKKNGCNNRNCVRPSHLEAVTQAENLRRGDSPMAVHGRKTHCIRGHEFSAENTRIRKDTGARQCVACQDYRNAQR